MQVQYIYTHKAPWDFFLLTKLKIHLMTYGALIEICRCSFTQYQKRTFRSFLLLNSLKCQGISFEENKSFLIIFNIFYSSLDERTNLQPSWQEYSIHQNLFYESLKGKKNIFFRYNLDIIYWFERTRSYEWKLNKLFFT